MTAGQEEMKSLLSVGQDRWKVECRGTKDKHQPGQRKENIVSAIKSRNIEFEENITETQDKNS
jgi:hypothetical protein